TDEVDRAGVAGGRVVVRIPGGDCDVEGVIAGRIRGRGDREVIQRRGADGDRRAEAVDSRGVADGQLLAPRGLEGKGEGMRPGIGRGERVARGQYRGRVGARQSDGAPVASRHVPRGIQGRDGERTRGTSRHGRRVVAEAEGDGRAGGNDDDGVSAAGRGTGVVLN